MAPKEVQNKKTADQQVNIRNTVPGELLNMLEYYFGARYMQCTEHYPWDPQKLQNCLFYLIEELVKNLSEMTLTVFPVLHYATRP